MTLARPVHHALFDFRLGDTPCAEAFDGFLDEGRGLIAGQIVPFSSNVIREEVVFECVFQPGGDCLSWNPPDLMEARRPVMRNLEITQPPLRIISQTDLDRPRRPDPQQVDAAVATRFDEVAKAPRSLPCSCRHTTPAFG